MEGDQSGEVDATEGRGGCTTFLWPDRNRMFCHPRRFRRLLFRGLLRHLRMYPLVPHRHVPIVLAFFAMLVKWFEKLWRKPRPPAAS
jgi:hypothetical protein